jgi:hypothetical protein
MDLVVFKKRMKRLITLPMQQKSGAERKEMFIRAIGAKLDKFQETVYINYG